jgi:hypothetical protein
VQVLPGTCAIKNRADTARDEMFVGRLYGEADKVTLPATDSSGGKSYLIVARVENPYEGDSYDPPEDPAKGPYIFTRVLGPQDGVTSTTTDAAALGLPDSMIALARIDLPASTGAITQGMIIDLRKLARVLTQHDYVVIAPTSTSAVSSTAYTKWGGAEVQLVTTVPAWATHVKLRAIVGGATHGGSGASNVYGKLRVKLTSGTTTLTSEDTSYNLSAPGGADQSTVMFGSQPLAIPSGMLGKSVSITLEGNRSSGSSTGDTLSMTSGAMLSIEADFERKPVSGA